MEAEIPSVNLKFFARTLYCLHKVGDVLTIEAAPDRLVLRALSRAESAYAQFTFLPSFFTRFQHGAEDNFHPHSFPPTLDPSDAGAGRGCEGGRRLAGGGLSSRSPSPTTSTAGSTTLASAFPRTVTVQVNSRVMQIPFRSGLSAVKRVTLRLCSSDDCGYAEVEGKDPLFPSTTAPARKRRRNPTGRPDSSDTDLCLIIQLHLEESAVVKSYRLPTLELTNVLSPNFSRQSCPTIIAAKAKKFLSWLQNFPESAPHPHHPPSLPTQQATDLLPPLSVGSRSCR